MNLKGYIEGGYNEIPGGGVACPACTDAALAICNEAEEEKRLSSHWFYISGLRTAEGIVIRSCKHGALHE